MVPARKPGSLRELGHDFVRKRDFYAGALMILFGLVAVLKGPSYRLGTLMHMGPGFMPTALGIILIVLGLMIAATALAPTDEDQRILPEHREWKGWGCILAGPLLFIVMGRFGLIPAAFSCVFVSALGERTSTIRGALLLAAVITAFAVGVFSYLLQVPMPLLAWR